MAIQSPDRSAAVEQLEGGNVKGVMLRSHVNLIIEEYGQEELDDLLGHLPRGIGSAITPILASQWYPFEVLIELDRAASKRFGEGNIEWIRRFGSYSAASALTSTYKLFRQDDLHTYFIRSAPLNSQFQDFGRVSFEEHGQTSARMIHSGYPCFSPVYCESALGYYEKVLELHGAPDGSVAETTCQTLRDEACIFELNW